MPVSVHVPTDTGFVPQRGMYTSGSKIIASPPPTCTSIRLFCTISTAQWTKRNESEREKNNMLTNLLVSLFLLHPKRRNNFALFFIFVGLDDLISLRDLKE